MVCVAPLTGEALPLSVCIFEASDTGKALGLFPHLSLWPHLTIGGRLPLQKPSSWGAWRAPSVGHATLDLRAESLRPTVGMEFTYKNQSPPPLAEPPHVQLQFCCCLSGGCISPLLICLSPGPSLWSLFFLCNIKTLF